MFDNTIALLQVLPFSSQSQFRCELTRVVEQGEQYITTPNRNKDDLNTVVETYYQYDGTLVLT